MNRARASFLLGSAVFIGFAMASIGGQQPAAGSVFTSRLFDACHSACIARGVAPRNTASAVSVRERASCSSGSSAAIRAVSLRDCS